MTYLELIERLASSLALDDVGDREQLAALLVARQREQLVTLADVLRTSLGSVVRVARAEGAVVSTCDHVLLIERLTAQAVMTTMALLEVEPAGKPPPCCPHPVERHAYNGCANCGCNVRWTEHPDRDRDMSPSAIATRHITRRGEVGDRYAFSCSCGYDTVAHEHRADAFNQITEHLREVGAPVDAGLCELGVIP